MTVSVTSERGLRMLASVPMPIRNAETYRALFQAEGAEFDDLRAAMLSVLSQVIVDTATADYLLRWEQILGLPESPLDTLSARRGRIKARLLGYGTATRQLVKRVIESFVPDVDVVEHWRGYELLITFPSILGEPENFADLAEAAREIAPANLLLTYEYRFNTYADLAAAAMTYADLAALTIPYSDVPTMEL